MSEEEIEKLNNEDLLSQYVNGIKCLYDKSRAINYLPEHWLLLEWEILNRMK